uniref:Uncharacterized protein LOC104238398 n=2 Tax=Nicotiana sylvestris TaxID=4096 RepID=A0A1U7XX05_NICSY|nr:PREDICTED: uncharacterized protein LOC104238398 [Nicotiana sylvestris]
MFERAPGTLPANTERNPKETVNVITLRSGKELKDPTPIQKDMRHEKESREKLKNGVENKKEGKSRREVPEASNLCQVLEGDPAKKRKIEETLVVNLIEHCNAILQNKLPQKCGDPGSFTIPFSLGTTNFDKSLCDSGASINLMSLSVYMKLDKEIGEIRSAPISLQLADQTTLILERIVEDVLVQVDKFVFLVDFIVVKMEENKEVPLILG